MEVIISMKMHAWKCCAAWIIAAVLFAGCFKTVKAAEVEAETETEMTAGVEAEAETEMEAEVEAETEMAAETETEAETEPETEMAADVETEMETETEAEAEAETAGTEEGGGDQEEQDLPSSLSFSGNQTVNWFGKTVSAVVLTLKADNTGQLDTWKEIQDALLYAKEHATDLQPCKIVIPAGTYNISAGLNIYSNTYLSMKGARIVRCYTKGFMMRSGAWSDYTGGYNGYRNILLEGGEWDGNAYNKTYGYTKSSHFSNLRFGHARNVTMTGVTVSNNVSAHCVEFGGVDGVVVKNCVFKDQINYKEADTGKYNGNEAIQIDVIHNAYVFGDYKPYDDAITKNVTITGNRFVNVMRGVGSHTGVLGKYYENINISNNVFQNILQQAVIAVNYRNARISNNTMTNVGSGVEFKYMTKNGTSYYQPVGARTAIWHDCASVISNNAITTWQTAEFPLPEGIRVMGWNMTAAKGEVLAGDYYISGISVTGNRINSNGYGMRMIDVRNSMVMGNIVFLGSDKNGRMAAASGIYLSDSENSVIQSNQVVNPSEIGIVVKNGSKSIAVKNNVVRGAKKAGIQIYNESVSNYVSGNQISDVGGCGIKVSANSGAALERNGIARSGKAGIYIYRGSFASIQYNAVYASGGNGISVSVASRNVTIYGNTVASSRKSGILVHKSIQGIKITGNTVDSSAWHGIMVKKGNASISRNTVTRSTRDGICLLAAKGIVNITGNTVKASLYHGIWSKNSKVSIKKNQLLDNKRYGISLPDLGTVKAIANNTLSNRGAREIYVSPNVKSSVKSMDAVKVKKVKPSSKKVTGTATSKTTVCVKAGKKKIKSKKLKDDNQFSVKVPKQKKGRMLRVESVDRYKNVAYQIVKAG